MRKINTNPKAFLTFEETKEFQSLAKKVYGIDLTLGEAEDQGSRLVMLLELMIKN